MLLAYLLIFLLHQSASACDATSRNQRLLLPAGAAGDVPAPSPATVIRLHGHTAEGLPLAAAACYHGAHYYPAIMARRGGPAAPRPSPGVEAASVVGGAPQPSLHGGGGVKVMSVVGGGSPPPPPQEKDTSAAAVEPAPSPRPQVEGGGGGYGAGQEDATGAGGDEGGTSAAAAAAAASEDHEETATHGVGVDYAPPKTHPPSHN